ncbi:MAG TPA: hypothetical protein VH092_19860 [Urbifossiella sp.]|jgi:hypothetical protein|nr:hypothetical protein [Urbifossiella sp.]
MRWIALPLVAACLCSCGKKAPAPAPPAQDEPEAVKLDVTPLLQFWDKTVSEHVYTYGDGQPAEYRRNPAFTGERVIGHVATRPYPDTVRLVRAYCRDQKHYFSLSAPPVWATDIERIEAFVVYVWTGPGNGRVPIHACFLPDEKDPYFDQDLKRVKDYADGTLKGIGKQRKVVENYFYVYPTGAAQGKATGTPPPAAPPAPTVPPAAAGGGGEPDWVVGMWIGKVGSRTVTVRYLPDGYFEESPTGSSGDAIYGTYTVQSVAGQRLEIRRDVGGTIIPGFNGPTSMTHPIGPTGERVAFNKFKAPDYTSPLKQLPLSPAAEGLRQSLLGRWKVKSPVPAKGETGVHAVEYRADGTFTYTVAVASRPPRSVTGRWVVTREILEQGKAYALNVEQFIEGRRSPIMIGVYGTSIHQPVLDGDNRSVEFSKDR